MNLSGPQVRYSDAMECELRMPSIPGQQRRLSIGAFRWRSMWCIRKIAIAAFFHVKLSILAEATTPTEQHERSRTYVSAVSHGHSLRGWQPYRLIPCGGSLLPNELNQAYLYQTNLACYLLVETGGCCKS